VIVPGAVARTEMMRFAQGGKKDEQLVAVAAHVRAGLGLRSVVLVGMPGCGKSAIGRRLAQRLAVPFVDADDEIEAAAGKAITDIFKDHGEPYFREGERKVIARILNAGPQVLATGGGAFMNAETRHNIRSTAVSVWLKAELPLLLRRVVKRNNRPLLERDPEGVMRSLVETRYPIYATADITVESRDLPHDVMVLEIIEALADHPALRQPGVVEKPAAKSTDEPA
jgi:shikimate kinase